MPITPHQQQMNWFHDSVLLLFFLFIRMYVCMVFVVVAAVCHLSVAFFIFRCAGFNSSVSLKATSNCRWPFFSLSLFAFLLLIKPITHRHTNVNIFARFDEWNLSNLQDIDNLSNIWFHHTKNRIAQYNLKMWCAFEFCHHTNTHSHTHRSHTLNLSFADTSILCFHIQINYLNNLIIFYQIGKQTKEGKKRVQKHLTRSNWWWYVHQYTKSTLSGWNWMRTKSLFLVRHTKSLLFFLLSAH